MRTLAECLRMLGFVAALALALSNVLSLTR